MKSKTTVSVGIAAYNEGKNIANILRDVLSQTETNWTLKEVLVYCDGCADNTVEQVNSIKDKRVKAIVGIERKGKYFGMNTIYDAFSGDILIALDADIRMGSLNVLDAMVQPFKDNNVMLVAGNSRPYDPQTFVERGVFSTFKVFSASRSLRTGNTVFGCTGACLGFRKNFIKTTKLKKVINEDAYLYFACISKGYSFRYIKDAVVYYKLPKNFPDYLRQVFRSNPEAVVINLNQHFGDLVAKEFYRPPGFYLWNVFKVFISDPLPVSVVIMINLLTKPLFPIISKRYKLEWFTATSTK